jgi:hypothetical protein
MISHISHSGIGANSVSGARGKEAPCRRNGGGWGVARVSHGLDISRRGAWQQDVDGDGREDEGHEDDHEQCGTDQGHGRVHHTANHLVPYGNAGASLTALY